MISGYKAMAGYLEKHANYKVHPDTLRKAASDETNPLPVSWDAGFAQIEPGQLLRWRENRKGIRRRTARAA